MQLYQITYFNQEKQSIINQRFKGENAFEEAIEWGKENLTNFNTDLIKAIDCDNPHCENGVVGESYGEKIYCGICN